MKKIVSFILLLFVSTCMMEGAIPAEERAALIAFYDATNGDNWNNNSGWKTPPLDTDGFALPGTEGSWYGIGVSNGHVTGIEMGFNGLTGSIPPELGNLSHLIFLFLDNNQLSGSIPVELGNLNNLESLNLSSNQLTGSIPSELGSLSNLQELWLGDNQLSGGIPPELGNFSNLFNLFLDNNLSVGKPWQFVLSLSER
jgi:hypothetical protein